MDSRRDAVRAQLNHTISMLEEELDRNLNLLGAAGMRATPKPVGVKVHFAPSRESSPAGNVEHTRGTHEAYQTPPSVVHSSRRPLRMNMQAVYTMVILVCILTYQDQVH